MAPARARWWAAALSVAMLVSSCGVTRSTVSPTGTPARDGLPSGTERPTSPPVVPPRTDDTPERSDPAAASLEWTSCDSGHECATLTVPVDHDVPDGATLELALVRRPARNQDDRIGSLLVNPGGPGGSAIEFVEGFPMPSALTDRFDIVGFDPRGVGRSTPLDCHSHLQDIYDADPTFEDAGDRTRFLDASQQFVDECAEKHGDLLAHLGTVAVARDMDLVRAAVADEQLTYIGYSYGTSIGEQYARLFPTKVRAMVLDGVVDPRETGLEAAEGQAEGFTRALDAFVATCDANDCLEDGAEETIDAVVAASERSPIPAPDSDRPATPGVVSLALSQALYSESLWPTLTDALDRAVAGDGDGLVTLADSYLQRNPDGSYSNAFEIYFAVSCLDSSWPTDPDDVFAASKRVGDRYPRVGEALLNDYVRCALWPVPPDPLPPVPTDLEGLAPIVVLSTTGDPATPYESGVTVAAEVPGAVLITNDGEGHTIFAQGKACVDEPVTAYLLDLVVPTDGLTC